MFARVFYQGVRRMPLKRFWTLIKPVALCSADDSQCFDALLL